MKNWYRFVSFAIGIITGAFLNAQVARDGVIPTLRPIAPTINAFGVSPQIVVQGNSFFWLGVATKGSADIKRYRLYVLNSQGGVWTQATDQSKNFVLINATGSSATDPRSFFAGPGHKYGIRFEVEDTNGISAISDSWIEILPAGSAQFVTSVAPESPRQTAFRKGDTGKILAVRDINNGGRLPGLLKKILIKHSEDTFSMLGVEINGRPYHTSPVSGYPYLRVADVQLWIAPGGTAKVFLIGNFLSSAKSAFADIAGMETDGVPYELNFVKVEHAIVEELVQEGLSSVKIMMAVSPGEPAVMSLTIKGQPGSRHGVLVRAIGPSLKKFGVENSLANPSIRVVDSKGNVVGENDDWNIDSGWAFRYVGAFALNEGSLDAALWVILRPGEYVVELRASGMGTGVVRLEAYQIPVPVTFIPEKG